MAVDSGTVLTLLRHDLRQLLRSPRTLFMSVVLPLLVWPLMLWISSFTVERQQERVETRSYRYVLTGEHAEGGGRFVAAAIAAGRQAADEGATWDFERISASDLEPALTAEPAEALAAEEVELWIEAAPPPTDDGERPEGSGLGTEGAATRAPTELRLLYRGDLEASQAAARLLQEALDAERRQSRVELLRERGVPLEPERLLEVESVELASAEQASGLRLGRFLTLVTLLFLLSGGSVVAMDTLAGEKERGTLETLLTTAASRLEIVVSKSLAIFVVGLVITAVQVANLLLWIGLEVIPLPEGFTVPVTPGVAAILMLLFLPLAALVSSALLLVSARARSYKEAQLLFFPLFLLASIPALIVVLPGVDLRSALVLVPVANLSVAVRDVLSGQADWLFVALAWTINVGLAVWLARVSIRALSSERLLTASDTDEADLFGGPPLFARHVLRAFAVLWAVFLIWQLGLAPGTDVRLVVSVNMLLFVGVAVWMIRHYRLDPRRALALRPVRPAVWVAVALGAPSGIVLAQGLAWLGARVLEVPPETLERFSALLFPERLPTVQLLLFFALLPGVCEEIAFRGVLLHGLRWKLTPIRAAFACAVVFALFHVDLFRLLPVGFLGLVLALLTLATGSLLPAVLWHVLNNGLALVVDRYADNEAIGRALPWLLPLAVVAFAASALLVWRSRTPYPDPRQAHRERQTGAESAAVR